MHHQYNECPGQSINELNILTEEFPPYNFVKDGKPAGIAVDILIKATEAMGEPLDLTKVNFAPWARAYKTALSGPNVMLFTMSRTEERENLFKWAGPVAENRVSLIAKKSAGLANVADPSTLSVKVGVVRDDIGEHLSIAAGVPKSIMTRNSQPAGVAKMLASGRVDVWAYPETTALQLLEDLGENANDYEVVYVLKTTGLYYAFSKDVDDSVVAKLQAAVDQIMK